MNPNFGLTSALPADSGIQKTGGDLQLKLTEEMTLKVRQLHKKRFKTGAKQTTTEVKVEKNLMNHLQDILENVIKQ